MTTTIDTDHLRGIAGARAAELGPDATADELLRWTAETFGTDFLIAANMRDAVLIDVADKAIDRESIDNERLKVLFLDTGYHFAETIGTRDAVVQVYDLSFSTCSPSTPSHSRTNCWARTCSRATPRSAAAYAKVVPLRAALSGFSAWVTGIRRVEAPTRANAPLISFDEGFGLVKINPLAAWSDEEFGTYIETHGVLVNPLVDEGYPSIGCAPCTAKPAIEPIRRAAAALGRGAPRQNAGCTSHEH